eukprot:scaffold6228_cov79-Cyclotella_meneghiniana.AAC.1
MHDIKIQRYTILVHKPPSKQHELILEDREESSLCSADNDNNDVNDASENNDREPKRIRGGGDDTIPEKAMALVKRVASAAINGRGGVYRKKPMGNNKPPTTQSLSVEQETKQRASAAEIGKPPTTKTSTVTAASSIPASAKQINKRKRPTKIVISQNSPLFNAVHDIRKSNDGVNTDKLTIYKDEWVKFALTNVIQPNMVLFKVEHTIRRTSCVGKSAKDVVRVRTKRRSTTYFRSNHWKTIWVENKGNSGTNSSTTAQDVMELLQNDKLYPMYLTFQRLIYSDTTSRNRCNPPPAKRLKTDSCAVVPTVQSKNEVIDLLDSSDDEEDEEAVSAANTTVANQPTISQVSSDKTEKPPSPIELTTFHQPPSDPIPSNFRAADNGDFVLTPYGAGKIVSSRIERHANATGNHASILKPTIILTIDLDFGICHIPAHQVKTISGTSYVTKTLLTYKKVPITAMDLLRLRPMTYLNDSIVNFYLKYLNPETKDNNKLDRGWDALDGKGVYIFPSFCYSQLVNIMANDVRNNKPNRQKIMKELKSWTKGIDIFKKRMLVFPINYNLHWTALFVFHPGRLIRRHAMEKDSQVVPGSNGPDVHVQNASHSNRITPTTPSPVLQNESVTYTVTNWQCDFCPERYPTMEEAMEHEKRCPKNKNQDFCMLHFDSGKHFKLHNSQTIAGYVRKYLSAYYDDEYALSHPGVGAITQANLPGYTVAVPQQDNTKDCGVCMLEIVERILKNPPVVDAEFVRKKCKVFAKDLFGKDAIVRKRDDILQLVHRLREENDMMNT